MVMNRFAGAQSLFSNHGSVFFWFCFLLRTVISSSRWTWCVCVCVCVCFAQRNRVVTFGIGQDGDESGAIDGADQRRVALLGIVAQRVVDVGLRHGHDHAIHHVDDAVGGLDVRPEHAGSVDRHHLRTGARPHTQTIPPIRI